MREKKGHREIITTIKINKIIRNEQQKMLNGTQFSYSVQQNRRREENSNAMEGNKCKVNTQRRNVKEIIYIISIKMERCFDKLWLEDNLIEVEERRKHIFYKSTL